MIHLIIATHGRFSEELVNTANMVFGDTENTHVVTFLPGEGQDDLVVKYNAIIATLAAEDAVLFLVDMFGGSPYNSAVRAIANRRQDDIITGVNLPILLEMLDNKDGSEMAELAAIAKEVAGMSVKSYRHNEGNTQEAAAVPAQQAETRKEDEDESQYDPDGRMNISLLRIDDRLIHGQVATSWVKAVKCEAIFAISDEAAADDLRRELLLQIAPSYLKAYVISVDKAIKVYNNPKYASRNVLMLVTKPEDILRLIEGGVRVKSVNVGGMTHKEGNKPLSQAVTVNASNVAAFKKLLEMGVDLSLQQVAANPKVPLTLEKLNSIQF
ncbi:mannose/fructose/sorbose PTS transporter subunit IIA [Pasteurellaceae bacterium LIM206]|nr:mannose/fructose/sorbose PTS transporter subunit IIA [Pasteurellaceae bacterium LIM206]